MNDFYRLLRFLLPGLGTTLEIVIYFFISDHAKVIEYLKAENISGVLSYTAGAILVITGIGYLMSSIYHSCLLAWLPQGADHRGAIQKAVAKNWLELTHYKNDKLVKPNLITIREAWSILGGIWHTVKGQSSRIQGADERSNKIADIVHGVGTFFVGSIFAGVIWLWLHVKYSHDISSLGFWIAAVLAVIVVILQYISYKGTVKKTQDYIEIIFLDELKERYENEKKPLSIYVNTQAQGIADPISPQQSQKEEQNMPDNSKNIKLQFQKDMFQTVWAFALKREGQYATYLVQVASVVGVIIAALIYGNSNTLFIAQVFSLIILGWGAAISVTTNYDYRINQAMSWALEKKFGARNDIVPNKFGTPKSGLIWVHKIHLITLRIIGILVILARFLIYSKTLSDPSQIYFEIAYFAILIIGGIALFYCIKKLIKNREDKFNKLFGNNTDWQSKIKELPDNGGKNNQTT